jgi:hypothetical protein
MLARNDVGRSGEDLVKPTNRPQKRLDPAVVFRQQIEAAREKGAGAEDLTLRLTLSDLSRIKRDHNLAVSDISFNDGVMRFLGVEVASEGVKVSELVRAGESAAN